MIQLAYFLNKDNGKRFMDCVFFAISVARNMRQHRHTVLQEINESKKECVMTLGKIHHCCLD